MRIPVISGKASGNFIGLFLATHAQIKDGVRLDGEQAKIPVATNYAIDTFIKRPFHLFE